MRAKSPEKRKKDDKNGLFTPVFGGRARGVFDRAAGSIFHFWKNGPVFPSDGKKPEFWGKNCPENKNFLYTYNSCALLIEKRKIINENIIY